MKVMSIVAWVLVVVLLVGAGALAFLGKQQSSRAAGLSDALLQVGSAAGVEGLAPEMLKDPAQLPDLLQQLQNAIQDTRTELASTKDALTAAQSEASGAKTESASQAQRAQEQAAKAEALAKDLVAKDEAINAAKAEAEKTMQEVKAAQEAAEKQKAEFEGRFESMKSQVAEEMARMQAELETAQQSALAAAPASVPGVGGEPAVAMPEPMPAEGEGRIVGKSEMFSLIRYSVENQTLLFNLQDGQTLTYREIPPEVYEQLVAAGNTIDMNYRFKIQGTYKSIPVDSIVVRKYWKRQRYNPVMRDVRVIDPPKAETEEPVAEETPAEEAPAEP